VTIPRTVGVDVVVVGVVVGVVVIVVVTLVVVGFLVVVVGVVVVVVGGGGGVVVTVVVASVTVVLGLMTSILEGFKFNWFLDFDCIRDLNDFRGNLKGLRVGLVKLTVLLVSIKLAMISSVVSTVVACCVVCGDGGGGGVGINDCGVSPAGSDSSWLATSSLPVSSAIFLRKLLLGRKRFLENKDFLENIFSFLAFSVETESSSLSGSLSVRLVLSGFFLRSGLTGANRDFWTIGLTGPSGSVLVGL